MPLPLPPLLSSRSERLQAVLVLGLPITFGLICGILLGVSEPAYLILSILAIGGGYGAGLEHSTVREGAFRGVIGGALFGGSILFAHVVSGADAKADLPNPPILLIVLTITFGAGLGALGARRRSRSEPPVAGPA